MKLIQFTFFLLFISSITNAQVKIGGKLSYGSEIESLGIGAKGVYDIDESFSVSGELNYFFGSNTTSSMDVMGYNFGSFEVETSLTTLNTDLHYNLSNLNPFRLYAIGGLNFSFYNTEFSTNSTYTYGQSGASNNETFIGLNLGIGGGYPISQNLDIISELKYIISDLDQVILSAGLIYKPN